MEGINQKQLAAVHLVVVVVLVPVGWDRVGWFLFSVCRCALEKDEGYTNRHRFTQHHQLTRLLLVLLSDSLQLRSREREAEREREREREGCRTFSEGQVMIAASNPTP